ncbi:protein stum homolog [Eriocheir sinensis]|uniref:protein stum homolog n=1 Tax=Eriocheir sinensis TaxID=95602 RepID=UPI0021C80819|nr:protein stum homolog [Eriocheir sinensis]XP_050725606.1 protein stum homolog [Eriocheir sinensis]XP_050725607.1 protein stum homolog [Eriocheir sinensis]XP_050725608.1 protein stum homolog [Eriocheir sinensis]XP_050725609.1 protein stum homolog [Eriocheir sinensis]
MEGNSEVSGNGAPQRAAPESPEGVDQPAPAEATTQKKTQHKDWLAVGGIGIEKRRRSSNASYRIENNKVMIDTPDGVQELEIMESKDRHGSFRKAVPALPMPLAALCLILSFVPGLGTFVAGLAVLCCGYTTENPSRVSGACWNLLAALLMVVLAPILVGLIWSVQRGVIILQESMKENIADREAKAKAEEEGTA